MKVLSGLATVIVFGAGLVASGMTNTSKVIGFLDVFGEWNLDLLMVMVMVIVAAAITIFIGFSLISKRTQPLFDSQFLLPTSEYINRSLIKGAVLFGLGWGLYGYCPGPAIAALVYLSPVTLIFVSCMLIGMSLINIICKLLTK
jgi:uncharacterized membrane protein YedE/YeeE